MRTTYDKEADAAYIYARYPVRAGEAAKTVEITEDIVLDFDKKGRLLGIEVLNARKRLNRQVLEEAEQIA